MVLVLVVLAEGRRTTSLTMCFSGTPGSAQVLAAAQVRVLARVEGRCEEEEEEDLLLVWEMVVVAVVPSAVRRASEASRSSRVFLPAFSTVSAC